MLNNKVEGSKEGGLATLPTIQLLHSYEPLKIIVIGEHLHYMRSAFEVIAELLEPFNDC